MKKPRKLVLARKRKEDKDLPKNFGSPARVIGFTILIFTASQLLAAILVEIFAALIHGGTNPSSSALNSAPVQFFYILIAEGMAVWLVLRLLKNRGLSLKQIGLGRRPNANDLIKGLIGFAAFFGILILTNLLMSLLFPELNNQKQDVGFNNLNTSLDKYLAFLALVLLPPIGEEILIRGYLYSGLRTFMRFVPAMLLTSLFFGLAHLQFGSGTAVVWAAGVDTFVLSVVLVYLREKTGALYAGMLIHALNNFIAFGVHFHS
jgi:membrane protease YdiL (CAAX protease family)